MPGHVFIIRGDLRRIACDAWLMPCSRHAKPESYWLIDGYDGPREGTPFPEGSSTRVQPLVGIPEDQPQPWLVRIAGYRQPIEWFVSGATEFLNAAAAAIIHGGRRRARDWPCQVFARTPHRGNRAGWRSTLSRRSRSSITPRARKICRAKI